MKRKKKDFSPSFTAHSKLSDFCMLEASGGNTVYEFFDEMGTLYGQIKRILFKDSMRLGLPPGDFKKEYLKRFGITARQFNALRIDLQGNIDSASEVLRGRIEDLSDRIASTKKWIRSKEAKDRKTQRDKKLSNTAKGAVLQPLRFAIHNKRRRLHALEKKLSSLKKDWEEKKLRMCFGSRRLYRRQFNLEENGYVSHEEWRTDWQAARSSQFYFVGSHEENAGNQTCTLSAEGTLRIRVPESLMGEYGKYINIPGVRYPYGQEVIEGALRTGLAITHRFVRKNGFWYLHTSVDMPKGEKVSLHSRDIGCIAVDVNEKEIAVGETDRHGNYVWSRTWPAVVKDKSEEQTEAIYGDICKRIVDRCVRTGKPLAHEDLDFRKKKASLREQGVRYSRMLSQFAYATFLRMLDARAYRLGVRVFTDNPAYTSVIGKVNFMGRYGITPHEAAAIAIARRIQGYSERMAGDVQWLPARRKNKKNTAESPSSAGDASPLPVRNRGEHAWSFWRRLKAGGACDDVARLYRIRLPLQGASGCAISITPISTVAGAVHTDTGRPPGRYGSVCDHTRGVGVRIPEVSRR